MKRNFCDCGCYIGNFLCVVERVKCFVNVHLHCIVRNPKKISKMPTFPLRKISADAHDHSSTQQTRDDVN